jgi:hypothetical protein
MWSKLTTLLIGWHLLAAAWMQAETAFVLGDGTPVRLRLTRKLSSADATVGETVDFEVLEDVKVNGVVVIARGATALATVTEAQPKRRLGRGGKLNVNIDYVRLVNGEKVALRAVKEARGAGKGGTVTGAVVATSLVFFPAAPLFLLMHGKDINVPKGREITAYVNGDVELNPAGFASPGGAAEAQPPKSARRLTNDDVLAMVRAGLSEDTIVAAVRNSPGDYRLEPDLLISLKQAGVSEKVLQAMLEASGK